jgi:hypothetical protein
MLNQFTPGSQNRRLLERLMRGPIYNHEIVHELGILKYTNRLSDVREAVRKYGYVIEAERVVGRVYEYSLLLSRPPDVPRPKTGWWEKIKSLWEVRI